MVYKSDNIFYQYEIIILFMNFLLTDTIIIWYLYKDQIFDDIIYPNI